MDRRTFLRLMALGGVAYASSSYAVTPGQQDWIPGHAENNDPIWNTFNGARISLNEDTGVWTAAFTDQIRALDGKRFSVSGFIIPIEASRRFTHFVLARRNSSCPFCPPNEPTEGVEIFADKAIEYAPEEITVEGRFHLVHSTSDGLFYRINPARIVT